MRFGAALIACTAGVLTHGSACAASCDHPEPLQFAPGAFAGHIQGGLARGELACWTLVVRTDQTLTLDAESLDNNAAFHLYAPGWRINERNGVYQVSGQPLPGAAEEQDAQHWIGQIRSSGAFLVVIGMIRGGGNYTLLANVR